MVSVNGITIAPPTPCAPRARSEHGWIGRERRGRRCKREHADPNREEQPPAEPIAERRAGQQEHRERERVGVHRPFELAERRVEVLADHRQRRRHDEVVERDHEERDRGDRKCPDRLRFVTRHLLPPEKKTSDHFLAAGEQALRPRLSYKSIEAMTLINIPVAKNRVTSCGGNPETRSTYETMSP
jgi:hypothetical protein